MAAIAPIDMADADVRKMDKDGRKITLKHGDIKNLDMPSMSMVFKGKDAAVLDTVQVGSKVKFMAEKHGGMLVVTAIEAVR